MGRPTLSDVIGQLRLLWSTPMQTAEEMRSNMREVSRWALFLADTVGEDEWLDGDVAKWKREDGK